MAEGRSSEPVHLEPFIHQVGGHSHMFSMDEATVCKPLISRELMFYETMPEEMKEFVPEYKGVIKVNFVEDSEGFVTLVAYPPQSYQPTQRSEPRSRRRFRIRRSGSIEIHGEHKTTVFEDVDSRHEDGAVPHNPWLLRCQRDSLALARLSPPGGSTGASDPATSSSIVRDPPSRKYILLENLTYRYQYPCILDLKMGTRQYADDDDDAKRQSKIEKTDTTTSGSLGVRINGMQVYQVNSSRFICRSKYYGRKLTVEGFKQALFEFLNNGAQLRTDLLSAMIARLSQLRSVLLRLESFRFFTTSLLIIYDGSPPTGDSAAASAAHGVDVRVIDFAHATHRRLDDPVKHSGPDMGFILGIENMVSMLKTLLHECG